MNLAEKLAATYLRLNGFLLLPHFTGFTGQQHNHIDLIGLRAANSKEQVGEFTMPIDNELFNVLTRSRGHDALTSIIGVAAEARTNKCRNAPSDEHIHYIQNFFGGITVSRLAFYEGSHTISQNGNVLDIGMHYTGIWIQRRIDQMNELRLTKTGSWNWSESFLSDLLAMRALNLLKNE